MEELSIKYQIMSKYTSFLCVNKNEEKSVEDLVPVEIVENKEARMEL